MELDTLGLQLPIFGAIQKTGGIAGGAGNYVILSDTSTNTILRYDNSNIDISGGHQVQINNAGNPVTAMATDSKGRVYLALGGRVDVLDTGSGRMPDVAAGTQYGGANSQGSLIFQTPQARPSFSLSAAPAKTFNQVSSVNYIGSAGAATASLYFVPQFAGVNTGTFSVSESSDLQDIPVWGKGIGGGAAFFPGLISQASSAAGAVGGVALDQAGNRYVTDSKNNTVSKITPSGTATKLAFTGLSAPTQIVVDALGAAYVLDTGNQRIEALSADGTQSDFFDLQGRG